MTFVESTSTKIISPNQTSEYGATSCNSKGKDYFISATVVCFVEVFCPPREKFFFVSIESKLGIVKRLNSC